MSERGYKNNSKQLCLKNIHNKYDKLLTIYLRIDLCEATQQ